MAGPQRWERLEDYLFTFKTYGGNFSAVEYAKAQEFSAVSEATGDIQSYLHAQRTGGKTLYVLKREPGTRTRNARWAVGMKQEKAADRRKLSRTFANDVRRRVTRALAPDLLAIARVNPAQAKAAEKQISAIVDGALVVLENSIV